MFTATRRWSEEFILKHPWHEVMSSVQFKYPNPYNNTVLNIDVLSRNIDSVNGIMHSCKLINSSWPMFQNVGNLKAIEYSYIHVPEKRMVTRSLNMDLKGVINGNEVMEYTVHPENKDWTLLKHTVSVEAFSLIAMSAISISKQSAYQGREALRWVIDHRLPRLQSLWNRNPGIECMITKEESKLTTSDPVFYQSEKENTSSNSSTVSLIDSKQPEFDNSINKQFFPSFTNSSAPSYPFFTEVSHLNKSACVGNSPHIPLSSLLGSSLENFSRDMSAITDVLVKRSQRVTSLFSRIDEYVVIL